MRTEENMMSLCNAATCIGAFVGLGIGIWASVKYLEPAFNETKGINDQGAKALTALVDLAGGLEMAAGAGALAGGMVVAMLACCYCCVKPREATHSTSLTLSSNPSSLYAPPRSSLVTEIVPGESVLIHV
ncbi:MAG: hypothetical protein CK426_01660 [Legionella sp.]|nr:MAG: hypothetical protein CK423_04760 [Legionella sp.]PJD99777.1 MAG: hypothetical protein CK426_01660 [Legionella sp.]